MTKKKARAMSPLRRISPLLMATLLTACATTDPNGAFDARTISTATGAAVGCVGGALIAKVTGQNAAAGCVAGAVAGGFVGFEKARQEEIAAATRAREETIAVLATARPASGGPQPHASEVKTVEVTAKDKGRGETRKYQAFESVTIDIPMSYRGTPQYSDAIGKLKTLAERVADERGSSRIDITMTSADARSHKVALETATAETPKGNPVTVAKVADNSVPRGIERFTVRAGALKSLDV